MAAAALVLYVLIGHRVRAERKRQGMTQDQLASLIGYARASMANLEAGTQRIPIDALFSIAEALDVEVPALLPSRATLRKAEQLVESDVD